MEYKQVKLSECTDIIIDYRGKTPKKLNSEWKVNGKYRAISAKNIKNNELVNESSIKFVDEELYIKWMKQEVENGDILLTSEAPLGESLYWSSNEKIVLSQRVFGIRANKKIVNSKFLFSYIQSQKFLNDLYARESGTTVTGIRRKELEKIIINVPSINTQEYIGKLHFEINSKIKLNKKIINTLEQISQTLFKRWFIDFEFPNEDGKPYKSSGGEMVESELGEIPKGWMIHSLSEYVDIKKGLSYKGEFLDKDKLLDESFPLISLSNFNFIKGFKDNKTKYYFGDYKQNHIIFPGDLIIAATDLTQDRKMLGAPALVPNLSDLMIYSLDVFKVIENNLPLYFLYFSLQTRNYRMIVEGNATGTTVLRISKDSLLSYKFPKSNNELEQLYHNNVVNIMNMISLLNEQSKSLEKLRESLLPKLLSGEIEIPEDLEV